jgi:hypothetical protein
MICLTLLSFFLWHSHAEKVEVPLSLRNHHRKSDLLVKSSFPDDPISGQPPLVRSSGKSCQVTLFQNASLSYWDEVVSSKFTIPVDTGCPYHKWSQIILDVAAFEQGTQFDRFGAVWINNIEVLRTTTPEPTVEGINWFIEKDITIYGRYFHDEFLSSTSSSTNSSSFLTAFVSIPNNVDSTYTGIIYLNAYVTFYLSEDDNENAMSDSLPSVLPLTKAPENDFLNSISLTGSSEFNYPFQLPTSDNNSLTGLLIDIYASGHGCEEFYYSNLPSENASDYGVCGNGIYREIQVYLNDDNNEGESFFAGSILPFPVIYTGGINPFLWRPLTGMMSFDIPAHRLDLTPFLGYLISTQGSKNHSITVKVFNNNDAGYWNIDCSLLLTHTNSFQSHENAAELSDLGTLIGGSIERITDTGIKLYDKSSISHNNATNSLEISFNTFASHYYHIEGSLIYSNGMKITYVTQGNQQTINSNNLIGNSQTRTIQNSSYTTESTMILPNGNQFSQSSYSNYPLYVEDYYAQDATSFDMQATVLFEYYRARKWTSQPAAASLLAFNEMPYSYEVKWSNQMISDAVYNRALDHTTVYEESDNAKESYRIWTAAPPLDKNPDGKETENYFHYVLPDSLPKNSELFRTKLTHKYEKDLNCFSRYLAAKDGDVTSQQMNGNCTFPLDVSFCGYELCGLYGFSSSLQQAASAATMSPKSESRPWSFPSSSYVSSNLSPSRDSFTIATAEKTVRFRHPSRSLN